MLRTTTSPELGVLLPQQLAASHRVAAGIERAAVRRAFARPPSLNALEWADTHFYLSPEFSPAMPGPYSSAITPYVREPLMYASDPSARKLVLMWGSQTAKTIVLMVLLGWTMHLRPCPIIMGRPKIDEAENWSKKRLAPMLRDVEVLHGLVSEVKGRTSDNTLRQKTFPGGFFSLVSAQSAAELAADSIALLLADEVERWPESAGSEGDPLELLVTRTTTVANALQVIASSVGEEDTSRILPEYLGGDQREFYVPCPLCGHTQLLLFRPRDREQKVGGLRWEEGRPDTAKYECEQCARLIAEKHKPAMLAAGQWRPAVPDAEYRSYGISGLYSPFGGLSWASIARRFLKAQGRPLLLKVLVTTVFNEPWKETGERVKSDELAGRLERYSHEVPDGVRVLTAAVDVHDHFLEYWVWGWGAGEESWAIDAHQIPGDPNDLGPKSPWRELDRLRKRGYKKRDGSALSVARGFVDIGGHHTSRVYDWTRLRNTEGWFACQGRDGQEYPLVGKTSYQAHAKTILFPVGTFKAKDAFLRSQVFVREAGPGYVHLPEWVSVEQLEGLVSEKRLTRVVKGSVLQVEWRKVRENVRNEPLDCRNYAYAALHSLGVRDLLKLGVLGSDDVPAAPETRRRRIRVISRGIQ